MRVFCDILLHIKDILLKYLRLTCGQTYTKEDIKWVLTVPAMWRASARDVMRQAAKEVRMYMVTCTSRFHHRHGRVAAPTHTGPYIFAVTDA